MSARQNINIASREFFQTSLITYLLLTLAETLREGFVSNFFNMNYLLLVVLVTGIVMVLTEAPESAVGQITQKAREGVEEGVRRAVPEPVRRQVRRAVGHQPAPRVLDLREAKPLTDRPTMHLPSEQTPGPAQPSDQQPKPKRSRQLG